MYYVIYCSEEKLYMLHGNNKMSIADDVVDILLIDSLEILEQNAL